MNNNIALPDDDAWTVDRYSPDRGPGLRTAPRESGDPKGIDFATIVRVVGHWRWLILGAIALGLLGAVLITLLTTPLYRSWVTLEVNPPTVEIMDEQSRQSNSGVSSWDFVATQVGLLSSRSIAERAAQDLNLANNKEFVGDQGILRPGLTSQPAKSLADLTWRCPRKVS